MRDESKKGSQVCGCRLMQVHVTVSTRVHKCLFVFTIHSNAGVYQGKKLSGDNIMTGENILEKQWIERLLCVYQEQ